MREGIYFLSSSFVLTGLDSGETDRPIVYRAFPDEYVRISGGRRLYFEKVTDANILAKTKVPKGHLVQTNLNDLNITEFGDFDRPEKGLYFPPVPVELFFNNKPMQRARWPNEDFARVEKVIDPGPTRDKQQSDYKGGSFVYYENQPSNWSNVGHIWLFGYWNYDWADDYLRIADINPLTKTITLAEPHRYGIEPAHEDQGGRYYALNVLEELDQPGEWYLDYSSGMLYFWPPSPIDYGDAYISVLKDPLILLDHTANIRFQDLTFEASRGVGAMILGGHDNLFASSAFRNLGTDAVQIGNIKKYKDTVSLTNGGYRNGIQSCDIYNTGGAGLFLTGGNRLDLTVSDNYAINNHIHHFGRIFETYKPAVYVIGVGNKVAHNLIHDAPHSAILYLGNENVFEFNEIYQVCSQTGDAGAFYTGRDWTMRGNRIVHNMIRDVNGLGKQGTAGVYLDDNASGSILFGNIFHNTQMGIRLGGGRDNVIDNNIFIDCSRAAIRFYSRMGRPLEIHRMRLEQIDYRSSPWRQQYPRLANILNDNPGQPKGNRITRNVAYRCKWLEANEKLMDMLILEHNLADINPMFVDLNGYNFQLQTDSPVLDIPGFQKIPIERIGLIQTEYPLAIRR
jgi:parallel beta-helix repeat protein